MDDRIITLDNGRIAEMGTYDEIIPQKYLYHTQAKNYLSP